MNNFFTPLLPFLTQILINWPMSSEWEYKTQAIQTWMEQFVGGTCLNLSLRKKFFWNITWYKPELLKKGFRQTTHLHTYTENTATILVFECYIKYIRLIGLQPHRLVSKNQNQQKLLNESFVKTTLSYFKSSVDYLYLTYYKCDLFV